MDMCGRSRIAAHSFGIRSFCAKSMRKTAPSSCVGARKISANARASSAFASTFLVALIMIKATHCCAHARSRNAPPIRIPGLFCASCAKNPFMLMCGRSPKAFRMLMRAWHSLGLWLAALIMFGRMIKATRCSAPGALPHRCPLIRNPLVLREEHAQNGSFLMCGRSENIRKCPSELGICVYFPRCFNHD